MQLVSMVQQVVQQARQLGARMVAVATAVQRTSCVCV